MYYYNDSAMIRETPRHYIITYCSIHTSAQAPPTKGASLQDPRGLGVTLPGVVPAVRLPDAADEFSLATVRGVTAVDQEAVASLFGPPPVVSVVSFLDSVREGVRASPGSGDEAVRPCPQHVLLAERARGPLLRQPGDDAVGVEGVAAAGEETDLLQRFKVVDADLAVFTGTSRCQS